MSTGRLTRSQQVALEELADGEWHNLWATKPATRRALERFGLTEQPPGSALAGDFYRFRITDAGRKALESGERELPSA